MQQLLAVFIEYSCKKNTVKCCKKESLLWGKTDKSTITTDHNQRHTSSTAGTMCLFVVCWQYIMSTDLSVCLFVLLSDLWSSDADNEVQDDRWSDWTCQQLDVRPRSCSLHKEPWQSNLLSSQHSVWHCLVNLLSLCLPVCLSVCLSVTAIYSQLTEFSPSCLLLVHRHSQNEGCWGCRSHSNCSNC